jgi:arginyl-tRNA synthetase
MKSENILESIRKEIKTFLAGKGVVEATVTLDKPIIAEHGDLATNIALRYAKNLASNPMTLASEIVEYLSDKKITGLTKVEVAKPGFINLFLSNDFSEAVLEDVLEFGDDFGKNNSLAGLKWVVEHTSPNPNKAMHLGHLRNNLVGMSITRLLEQAGANVICEAVNNDRGIAIAKMMYGYLAEMRKDSKTPIDVNYWVDHQNEWKLPEDLNMLPDIFATKCYVLGEAACQSSSEIDALVREMVVKWEAKDENIWKLWSYVLEFSYRGIRRTLTRLGNRWDKVWNEHEHYQAGKDYVQKGLEMGIFKKLEDGAVLTDLEKYNLTDTILLKKDGTALYITQDIALTDLKKKTHHADRLIWVIGPDQSLAMKQMFAVCEQLGIGKVSDFTHVSYGYVALKDESGEIKKMSSRAGTVVLIDDVLDLVKSKILERFQTDNKIIADPETLAEKLAIAAVKFSFLKPDRNQDTAFDIENSIQTTGDSGVYVMYTYARAKSVLRKAGDAKIAPSSSEIGGEVIKMLALYPEVLKKSQEELSAHHIAQYILSVCAAFNSWYGQEMILDGGENQAHKLALTKAVAQVIKNALAILGIEVAEEI